MSIIRLSAVRERLCAPDQAGNWDDSALLGEFDAASVRPDTPRPELTDHLRAKLAAEASALPDDRPLVVMVHGFQFNPTARITGILRREDNAHGRLFHFTTGQDKVTEHRERTTSWPDMAGIADNDAGAEGVAIAFAWHSAPSETFKPSRPDDLIDGLIDNFYETAYDWMLQTSGALAISLQAIADLTQAGREIDIVCHSLGTALVTQALLLGGKHRFSFVWRLGRVVLLDGAEYQIEAQTMLDTLAGFADADGMSDDAGPRFYNIGNTRDVVLDKLGENFGPKKGCNVIGHKGIGAPDFKARWMDIALSSGAFNVWARNSLRFGYFPAAAIADFDGISVSGLNHWVCFTFDGNRRMWRDLLNHRRADWAFDMLREPRQAGGPLPEGIH
jgi:hypothetical protein